MLFYALCLLTIKAVNTTTAIPSAARRVVIGAGPFTGVRMPPTARPRTTATPTGSNP